MSLALRMHTRFDSVPSIDMSSTDDADQCAAALAAAQAQALDLINITAALHDDLRRAEARVARLEQQVKEHKEGVSREIRTAL